VSASALAAPRHPLGGRLAWLVVGTAIVAYIVAVFHRFSLGVASIEAAQRFGIGASALALFSLVQLFVYAAMQIPVGVLLDRYGARRLLLTGSLVMAAGQALFAVGTDFPTAVAARVLLGCGDAMIFISALRLVAAWFPPHRNPVVLQLTGVLGQLGALLSAVPLVAVLGVAGWTPTFLGAALVGVAVAAVVLAVVRNSPYAGAVTTGPAPSMAEVRRQLRGTWAEPGTRLGFWTHFVTQFSGTVFVLLWGFPFLVSGQGLPAATAGLLLSLLTFSGMVVGPLLGQLVARYPFYRSWLVLGIVGVTVTAWTTVLLWPGRAPLWLLVLLVLAMAPNGPGSMIGFDYARTFNDVRRLGSASGVVNVGGFTASLVTVLLIGLVLDALTPGASGSSGSSDLTAYRWAFSVQYLLWALGIVQVLRYRRRARRVLAERDPDAYAALRRGAVVTS
jgi:MFS family permease